MIVKVKVPATTANLGPGFDCLGVALDLYNEFELVKLNDKTFKLDIDVIGEGQDIISRDNKNIVYQAIERVCSIYKKKVPSLSLKILNKIPVERGLGSSASAYVAGVIFGNILCGSKLKQEELLSIATELEGHPDNVVPAMLGGLCVSKKIDVRTCNKKVGIELKYIKLLIPKDLCAMVLVPEIKISTKKAREVLPKHIDYNSAVKNVSNVSLLIASILKKDFSILRVAMEDYLHQPFRKKIMPWLDEIFDICLKNKALGVSLSGSGSSIIALYEKKILNKNTAEKIKSLVDKKLKVEYKILNFVSKGAVVELVK